MFESEVYFDDGAGQFLLVFRWVDEFVFRCIRGNRNDTVAGGDLTEEISVSILNRPILDVEIVGSGGF
jgi:hypothetical protein